MSLFLARANNSTLCRLTFCMLLFLSIAAPRLAISQIAPPTIVRHVDENHIDIKTGGTYTPSGTHLTIGPSDGGHLSWELTGDFRQHNLNSLYTTGGPLGDSVFLYTPIGSASFIYDNLNSDIADGIFFFSSSSIQKLVNKYGAEAIFQNNPTWLGTMMVSAVKFPSGEIWTLYYDIPTTRHTPVDFTSSQKLISVSSNFGYLLKFTYGSDNGTYCPLQWCRPSKVTAINTTVDYCDPAAVSCSALTQPWKVATQSSTDFIPWGYRSIDVVNMEIHKADGSIFSVVRNGNTVTSPLVISAPGEPTVTYKYGDGGTTTLTTPDGVWTYQGTTRKNPAGGLASYAFKDVGRGEYFLYEYTDEIGRKTTYTRDIYGRATKVLHPEGNYETYTYDERGNILKLEQFPKPGSGLSSIVSTATYPPSGSYSTGGYYKTYCNNFITCNRPITMTDGNGNTTSYTYDPLHGGILTETRPPVGGINPVTRFSYVQRYALIKNSTNTGWVQASSPIWLLAEERTCKTSSTVNNACAAGASDEVVTTYDYGPTSGQGNNLLLRGKVVDATGLALRTCYAYDIYGNRISETKPNAGLAWCP